LNQLDLKEETIVIFYSDNGGVGGYKENGIINWSITSQKPLRGGKGMFYEGGIREPLVVRWPGVVEAGSKCHTPVISIDFYPTFIDIAGIEKKEGKILDGKSILPLLKQNGNFAREAIYWHFPAYLQGSEGTFRTRPVSVIRSGNYKLLEFFEDNRLELYNLEKDIGENNELSDEKPAKTRELHRKLREWRESIDAPVPEKLNPDYYKYEEVKK
jgi:arylsulfatase A-like enzyme